VLPLNSRRIKRLRAGVPARYGRCYDADLVPPPSNIRTSPLRFGIFEVDLTFGELRKQGVRIKLQEQPFQALVALVERPREVVTREELQKRLWPDDTLVDFDRGLNKAINRLREALGDDAVVPVLSRHFHDAVIDSSPRSKPGRPT
jgi:DNA-binding response OmpR family regulator